MIGCLSAPQNSKITARKQPHNSDENSGISVGNSAGDMTGGDATRNLTRRHHVVNIYGTSKRHAQKFIARRQAGLIADYVATGRESNPWYLAFHRSDEITVRLRIGTRLTEMPALFTRFISITGPKPWTQREQDFARRIKDNPLIKRYLDIQFPIERMMIGVRRHLASTGRLPSVEAMSHPDMGMLYSFVGVTSRVFRYLPQAAQARLKSKIAGALKDDVGLTPLAFEMRTAAHFLAMDFDVEFSDLNSGTGFDFLVTKPGVEIEVECKSVSADLGHQIHLFREYQLGPYLIDGMKAANSRRFVQLVVATLPDRLHGQREFIAAVSARINEALYTQKDYEDFAPCTVTYKEFPIENSPFESTPVRQITEMEVSNYLENLMHQDVGHTIFSFSPKRGATIVALRSLKPDKFLTFLYRNLRETAAAQFSKMHPGVICVQLRHMTNAQLRDVAAEPGRTGQPTGVQVMTAKFLNNPERAHVHTVAYVAPGDFVSRRSYRQDEIGLIRDTAIGEDARSYSFTNDQNPEAENPAYRVF